jgi:hypothetical protein
MSRKALLALGVLLAGCGGREGAGPSTAISRGGKAVLNVIWPNRSTRLIPNASNSLVVTLSQNGQTVATATIARPTSGKTTTQTAFTDLPIGSVNVSINAFPTATGTGTAQAAGQGILTVPVGTPGSVTVSLASTVASLGISTSQNDVEPGGSETLTATAYDSSGNIVLLSAGGGTDALTWSSGTKSVATVSGTGPTATLFGIANGTTMVTAAIAVADSGTTVSGVYAAGVGANYLLARGGYPKTHGDIADTGQGGGQGAKGVQAWSTSIGSGSVGTVIVGPDETIYASIGGTVTALTSAGSIKWTQTVTGTITGLLLTRNQLYVGAAALTSLNNSTGAMLWTFATDASCFEPNVGADGTIYQATADSIYSINPVTRAVNWQVAFASNGGAVVAGDGTLVAWNESTMQEMNSASGATIASEPANSGETFGAPCGGPATVYFDRSTRAGKLRSWQISAVSTSGALIWTTRVGQGVGLATGFVALSPGGTALSDVAAGQTDGEDSHLYCISSSGAVTVGDDGASGEAASLGTDGTAFLSAQGYSSGFAGLASYSSVTGAWRWGLSLSVGAATPAVGPSGTVYEGTSTGSVVAVK